MLLELLLYQSKEADTVFFFYLTLIIGTTKTECTTSQRKS